MHNSERINQYLEDCPSDCIRLFHGTNITAATNIVTEGLDFTTFKMATDFGPSFYTTPDYNYALYWAMTKRYHQHGALVVFDVPKTIFNQSNTLYLEGDEWKQVIFCCSRSCLLHLDTPLLTKLTTSPVVVGKIVANVGLVEGVNGSPNPPLVFHYYYQLCSSSINSLNQSFYILLVQF